MNKLLDKIPMVPLIVIALWLAVAPIAPQPHLWEKLRMLFDGSLSRPLDIFDLLLHGTPLVLLLAKLARTARQRARPPD